MLNLTQFYSPTTSQNITLPLPPRQNTSPSSLTQPKYSPTQTIPIQSQYALQHLYPAKINYHQTNVCSDIPYPVNLHPQISSVPNVLKLENKNLIVQEKHYAKFYAKIVKRVMYVTPRAFLQGIPFLLCILSQFILPSLNLVKWQKNI